MFKNWFTPNVAIKIGFEDIKFAIQNPDKYILINTLGINEQSCLIKNTVQFDSILYHLIRYDTMRYDSIYLTVKQYYIVESYRIVSYRIEMDRMESYRIEWINSTILRYKNSTLHPFE